MTEWEDPELMSFHRQTKTAIMYKTTLSEKDLKTSRTALPQLRILKKKITSRWSRRNRDTM